LQLINIIILREQNISLVLVLISLYWKQPCEPAAVLADQLVK
jgi:hypothetical protein